MNGESVFSMQCLYKILLATNEQNLAKLKSNNNNTT